MSKQKTIPKSLTIKQVEEELKREKYKSKYKKVLKNTIYSLIIIAAVSALIVTLVMPVLEVSETSMKPTLNEGEIVITLKAKKLHRGDIIAFYQGNKILLKRVIATPGDFININDTGDVTINGTILDEPYINNKTKGDTLLKFPYQVLENQYFVLNDDRQSLIDSRNEDIGCIKKEDIIGKVIFRIWPFKSFGSI